MRVADKEVDYGALFAASSTPSLVLTPDLVIRDANPAHLRATGRSRDAVVGRHLFEVFPDNPSDPSGQGVTTLRASIEQVLATGRTHSIGVQRYDITLPVAGLDAFEQRLWRVTNTPVLAADGSVRYVLHAAEDVTEIERAEAERVRNEERFRALVEHASDLILVLGSDRRVTYMSPGAAEARVLERRREELRWGDLTHPEDKALSLGLFARVRAAAPGQTLREQFRLADDGNGIRWIDVHATNHLDHPAIRGIVVNARDITEQRRAEQLLVEQAVRDPLTGLPNRRWFLDALARATARATRSGRPVGVLLADVDDFKLVNDTLGHAAGDRLLVELAQRVSGALRPSDTVARLGGDEFVVLAEDLEHARHGAAVAERIAEAASGHYDVGASLRPRIALSMGVSTSRGEVDPDTLLSHADAALYEAKRRGRNRIQVFSSTLRQDLVDRLHTEHELDQALTADGLALHWQPIVRTEDGEVVAAEALVRWHHRERGLLAAADFLPAARSAGLMPRVCEWVLAHAVEQAAAWSALPNPLKISINLSPAELADAGLPATLAGLAAARGIEPGRVQLEVSETILPGQVTAIRDRLVALRELGFGIALDDFGAGNTALAWLQVLPIDTLKLDRRFSSTIDTTATRAIVSSIVQLAAALGIASLAEGIQTHEQLTSLTDLGCDYTQGFLLGRPQAADELTARLTPA
jgi:diguanylate cyclase (GGDEF)-like protein/PAS domain S-box-containing protein